MKLVAPPIKVDAEDGFANDVLGRKSYGEALCNIISNSEDELVICLDGKWGEGKTTFVKMFCGVLVRSDIPSIYIDAFSSDHIEDPFFAVASEISAFAEEMGVKEETKSSLKEHTVAVGVQLLSWGAKIGLKAATLGALTASDIEALGGVKGDIAEGISGVAAKFVQVRLDAYSSSMAVFDEYRKSLSELPQAIGNEKTNRLVVIIDELDRCKPTFAVSLIEQVKHLFSVPNVVFLLVMNKEQLQQSIRSIYGQGVDASTYLQKFINLETRIPRKNNSHDSDAAKYIDYLWKVHDFEAWGDQHSILECLKILARHFDLSLREMERVFTNIAVLYGTTGKDDLRIAPLIVFLAVLKVTDDSLFNKLRNGQIGYQELIEQPDLVELEKSSSQEGQRELQHMFDLIRFAVSTEDEFRLLPDRDQDKFSSSLGHHGIFREDLLPIFTQRLSDFIIR